MVALMTTGVRIPKTKYRIGLPGSDSWHSRTPKYLKMASEFCILIGGIATLIIANYDDVSIIIKMSGGIATLVGRFFAKCVSIVE